MLIIFSLSTKRKDIIRVFAKSHMIVRDGNTKELSYNHEAFVDTFRSAYYSKISVGFIAAGYIIGVFGDIGDSNRWIVAWIIVALTAVLIMIAKIVIEKTVSNDIKPITNDELQDAGVEVDMESMSNQVIDEILELGGLNLRGKQSS